MSLYMLKTLDIICEKCIEIMRGSSYKCKVYKTNGTINLQTLRFHFYVNHAIISRLCKISRKIAALVVSSGWKLTSDEATGG